MSIPSDAIEWSSAPGWYLSWGLSGWYLTDGVFRTRDYITPNAAFLAMIDNDLRTIAAHEAELSRRLNEHQVPSWARTVMCAYCKELIVWCRDGTQRIPLSVESIECRDGVRYAVFHVCTPKVKSKNRKLG